MTGPMTDERLAEIEACAENYNGILVTERPNSAIAHRVELLAEVKRLRALVAPTYVTLPADTITPDQVDEFKAAWQEMLEQPQKITVLPSQAEQLDAASYHIRAEAIPNSDGLEAAVLVDHAPCETTIYGNRADDVDDMDGAVLLTLMTAHHCNATAARAEIMRLSGEFKADLANPIRLEPHAIPFRDKPRGHDYPMGG